MRKPFNGDYQGTQAFGENPPDYARFGLKGHNGLDFGLPSGTPVVSPHKGNVQELSFDPLGYGWYIKIQNDTEGSVLAHLTEGSFSVKVGDYVDEGQKLALSDNTGNSTGPHLHWGYYRFPRDRSNGYSGFIDQTPFLTPVIPPQPQPADLTITDQTKIDMRGVDGVMEVQAIRSTLAARLVTINDQYTQIQNLTQQIINYQDAALNNLTGTTAVTTVIAADNTPAVLPDDSGHLQPQSSLLNLIAGFFQQLWKKYKKT